MSDISNMFLANFVHQIVNPINGVIGTLNNIEDGTIQGNQAKQKIGACRGQLEQCVNLIRNLAYLSDFLAEGYSQTALRESSLNVYSILPQVIIEAMQFYQVSGTAKDIKLELNDIQTQYRVTIRPELLRQVFCNLFDNWIKYGLSHQVVSVEPHVNQKGELVIEITGKSIGFDNSIAPKLFEMSYRADEAKKRYALGTGIGLYICKKIIDECLGGSISALHSQKNSQTQFRIAIPEGKWKL